MRSVINEIEIINKEKELNRNIEVSNEKIKELNKFLKKCEMNFKNELKDLIKKFNITVENDGVDLNSDQEEIKIYRKPIESDLDEELIKGFWSKEPGPVTGNGNNQKNNSSIHRFIPDPNGNQFAIEVGKKGKIERSERVKKKWTSGSHV